MNELTSWSIHWSSLHMGVLCMTASCTFLVKFVAVHFSFLHCLSCPVLDFHLGEYS